MGAVSAKALSRTPNTMQASVAADSAKYLHEQLSFFTLLMKIMRGVQCKCCFQGVCLRA